MVGVDWMWDCRGVVCVDGFEPPTSPTRTERSTSLSYTQKNRSAEWESHPRTAALQAT